MVTQRGELLPQGHTARKGQSPNPVWLWHPRSACRSAVLLLLNSMMIKTERGAGQRSVKPTPISGPKAEFESHLCCGCPTGSFNLSEPQLLYHWRGNELVGVTEKVVKGLIHRRSSVRAVSHSGNVSTPSLGSCLARGAPAGEAAGVLTWLSTLTLLLNHWAAVNKLLHISECQVIQVLTEDKSLCFSGLLRELRDISEIPAGRLLACVECSVKGRCHLINISNSLSF